MHSDASRPYWFWFIMLVVMITPFLVTVVSDTIIFISTSMAVITLISVVIVNIIISSIFICLNFFITVILFLLPLCNTIASPFITFSAVCFLPSLSLWLWPYVHILVFSVIASLGLRLLDECLAVYHWKIHLASINQSRLNKFGKSEPLLIGRQLYTAHTVLQAGTWRASHVNYSNSCGSLYIRRTRCCSHNSFHTSLAGEIVGCLYSMEGKINILQPGISGAIQCKRWDSTGRVNAITKTRHKGARSCIVACEHMRDPKMHISELVFAHTQAYSCFGNEERP